MIDLHIHSYYSDDGEFLPKQLIELAKEAKLEAISIADHNSIKANVTANKLCQEAGINYVAGIEIDCLYQGQVFHVLGYYIDCHSKDFSDIEENVYRQNKKAGEKYIEYARSLGFDVSKDALKKLTESAYHKDVFIPEMLASVLLSDERYLDNELLLDYRPGGKRGDNPNVNFFWDFYAQSKPGYVEIKYPKMSEVVKIIHHNGGLAILAHPGQNLKEQKEKVKDIIKLGFDGIEVFSSYHSEQDVYYYYEVAEQNEVLKTCGSDFHGSNKPAIKIGQINIPKGLYPSSIQEMERRLMRC